MDTHALFRSFHTIKGMSATMRVEAITLLAHALEDICDSLVRRKLARNDESIGLLRQGVAALRAQFLTFEQGMEPLRRFELEEQLRRLLTTGTTTGFNLLSPREVPALAPLPPEPALMTTAAVAEILACTLQLRANAHPDHLLLLQRIDAAATQVHSALGALRHVSLSALLGPLRRQIRDIARQHQRLVQLEIVADEEILLENSAPLQVILGHIVSNAIVHGLESPGERLACGKEPEGRLRLEVQEVSGSLLIHISDDGRGFDAERLRSAAGQPHADPVALAFLPGVSTARQVDHHAGRGFGLPAVQQALQNLGGQLQIQSTPGHGTMVRVEVPARARLQHVTLCQQGDTTVGYLANLPPAPGVLGRQALPVTTAPFPFNLLPTVAGTTIGADGKVVFVLHDLSSHTQQRSQH